MKTIIIWVLLLFIFTTPAYAHSGRTNSSGCHNCYTGACAGTYHCHGGGSNGYNSGYTAPVYTPPKPRPLNPTTGSANFSTSGQNWCNHDISMTWDGATGATGYSVGISKTAGADPGPIADTTNSYYTFENITPGKWYVNVKSISSTWGTSANQVVYWEVNLPKIEPSLTVNIVNDVVSYNFQCLDRVEAPDFLISEMKQKGNHPSGAVSVAPFGRAQTFTVKGWDAKGKQYEKTLTYNPVTPAPIVNNSESSDSDGLVALGVLGTMVVAPAAGILWLRDKWRNRSK